ITKFICASFPTRRSSDLIGRSASGHSLISNKPRVTKAAHIYTKALMEVSTPLLSGYFADAIYRGGIKRRILRSLLSRRIRSKNGNRAGPKNAIQITVARQLQHIQQSAGIQFPSQFNILLRFGRKQGCKVIDLRNSMLIYDLCKMFFVQHIQLFERAVLVLRFTNVRRNDLMNSVQRSQLSSQLTAQLTASTRN